MVSDLSARVEKVIAAKFGISTSDLAPETSFTGDLHADSLDLIELAMAFEKEFGIEITDSDLDQIGTVGDALQFMCVAK